MTPENKVVRLAKRCRDRGRREVDCVNSEEILDTCPCTSISLGQGAFKCSLSFGSAAGSPFITKLAAMARGAFLIEMGSVALLIRHPSPGFRPELFHQFLAGGVEINHGDLLFAADIFHRIGVSFRFAAGGRQSVGDLSLGIECPVNHWGVTRMGVALIEGALSM